MFSVILVVEESHVLLSLRLEDNFQLHNIQFTCKIGGSAKLCSYVAIGCLVPDFSGIFCVLIDVLVEFVCLSESGLWLMTTQETIFSTCKELILISIQHLPQNRVTYTSSAGPMTVLSSIILIWVGIFWHLSYLCIIFVVSLQFSTDLDGFVKNVCPTEIVIEYPVFLETFPRLEFWKTVGAHHARALLQKSLGDMLYQFKSRSKSGFI